MIGIISPLRRIAALAGVALLTCGTTVHAAANMPSVPDSDRTGGSGADIVATAGIAPDATVDHLADSGAAIVTAALDTPGEADIVVVSSDGNSLNVDTVAPEDAAAHVAELTGSGADIVAADRNVTFTVVDADAAGTDTITPAGTDGTDRRAYRWAYEAVRASVAWRSSTGVGTVVAVIDTGVDATHPDFGGRVLTGASFSNGGSTPGTVDASGHGTHVAGIIAATARNGIGTDGIANGATILPVRAIGDDGYGQLADIVAAIIYATDQGADVINLSLMGPSTTAGNAAIDYATSRGVLVVGAVGNGGKRVPASWPSTHPSVIGVGAIDAVLNSSTFSQIGPQVDFVAPGSTVYSLAPGGGAVFQSGTSMATPHVVGALAVLLPLTGGDVNRALAVLRDSARDLGAAGRDDTYGYGLIDLAKAHAALLPTLASDSYIPYGPARLLDTREQGAAVNAGSTTVIAAPANVVAGGLGRGALALNVTVTGTTGPGFLTIWPCDTPMPLASNGNYTAGATRATSAIAPVSAQGTVCVYNQAGTHLVVDMTGWYPAALGFNSMTPQRLYDSRNEPVPMPIPAGETIGLNVVRRASLPDDATAVALTVTATEPSAAGFVTVFPCGQDVPTASNVNFVAGETVANTTLVAPNLYGTVCFYLSAQAHVVVDITGWLSTAGTGTVSAPARALDTRAGTAALTGRGRPPSPVALRGGEVVVIPTGVPSGRGGVIVNVTVTEPSAAGFVTLWPCDGELPPTSTLNFVAGQTTANSAVVPIGANGDVCAAANVPTHLVVDVSGWFTRTT